MKIALVHDWLLEIGGAEIVLKEFHGLFPAAPIYCLYHNPQFTDSFLAGAEIRPSFIQKFPVLARNNTLLAPLFPVAVESLDLSEFDLVVSTAPFAKGLILKSKTKHVHYCSSPTRQLWDWQAEYARERRRAPKFLTVPLQHFARIWDRHASSRVDFFIANSLNTQERIKKYYRADSKIIYPPVSMAEEVKKIKSGNYFLIVSRLFKHKNIRLAVDTFLGLGFPLVIIGSGPELGKLKKIAKNSNIKFLGFQPDEVLEKYYAGCQAFIMPQEEDFGLTPIEAMSYGKPVLALKRGGALEYVKEGINGEFFDDPVIEVLADGVRRLNQNYKNYDPEKIKWSASRFSKENFRKEITSFLNEVLRKKSNVNLFN